MKLAVRAGAAMAVLLGMAGAAAAQDRPVWPPSRDATVTYKITPAPGSQSGQNGPTEMTISYSATLQKMRMDVGPQGYLLVDTRSQSSQMVMPQQKMIMTLPSGGPGNARMFDFSGVTNAKRGGTRTIAGTSCTLWQVTRPDAGSNEACLTDDGVMLSAHGGSGSGSIEATKVAYASIPAANFEPPAGFRTMQVPAGMPPGAGMPPHR